jgi:hypothetical protein
MSETDAGFLAALEEGKKGAAEGGVPIGACLVSKDGKILGQGHNMRVQNGSAILHVSKQPPPRGGLPCICHRVSSHGLTHPIPEIFRPRCRRCRTLGAYPRQRTRERQCTRRSRRATCAREHASCTRSSVSSSARTRRSSAGRST